MNNNSKNYDGKREYNVSEAQLFDVLLGGIRRVSVSKLAFFLSRDYRFNQNEETIKNAFLDTDQ